MYGCNNNNYRSSKFSNGKKQQPGANTNTVTVTLQNYNNTRHKKFSKVYEGKNVQIQKYNFQFKKGFSQDNS